MRAAGVAAVIVAGALGVGPAHGTGFYVTEQRFGSASAATGAREATVSFTDVRFTETEPEQPRHDRPYVCVSLRDNAKQVYAAACKEMAFETATDLSSARAVGSVVAPIRRSSTGAVVGSTTLRFDVRWTSMTYPLPRVYGGANACPKMPWATFAGSATTSATAELVSFGSAVGTVSSATLGTVRYRWETLTWNSVMAESAGHAVWQQLPTEPLAVDPACYSVWGNVPAGRVLIGS